MANSTLGRVEVRKSADSPIWYNGHIVDLAAEDALLVAFEGNVWPQASYATQDVRKPPKHTAVDLDAFAPQVGQEVEMFVIASPHAPANWSPVRVQRTQHGLFFVTPSVASTSDGKKENIVEKAMLRPFTVGGSLGSAAIHKDTFELPPELHDWTLTSDGIGCFTQIEQQSGLAQIQAGRDSLNLVGNQKALQRAKMLVQMHIDHQGKIQKFQGSREKRLKALELKRNRIEGTNYKFSTEVRVEAGYVGRIIGSKGETVRALQDRFDVNIRVSNDSSKDDEDRVVKIFGHSQISVDRAKAEVEFVYDTLHVDDAMYNWVLGSNGRNIQQFKEQAGLAKCSLDKGKLVLHLHGTRRSVEDAIAMFETHMMYYPVFKQMDEEMEQLVTKLEQLGDYNARWKWGWFSDEEDDNWYASGNGWEDSADWNEWHGGSGGGEGTDWSYNDGRQRRGKWEREGGGDSYSHAYDADEKITSKSEFRYEDKRRNASEDKPKSSGKGGGKRPRQSDFKYEELEDVDEAVGKTNKADKVGKASKVERTENTEGAKGEGRSEEKGKSSGSWQPIKASSATDDIAEDSDSSDMDGAARKGDGKAAGRKGQGGVGRGDAGRGTGRGFGRGVGRGAASLWRVREGSDMANDNEVKSAGIVGKKMGKVGVRT